MAFFACLAPSLSPTDSRLRQPILEHRLIGFTTSPPHPLSMNGEGDKCFSCRNKRIEKSTITQKPSPKLTTHQANHKKPHPNSQHTRPNTTHQASPPHEMRPNGRISGGVGGLVPPQKTSKGRGGTGPPTHKKGGVCAQGQRPEHIAAVRGAYPPMADSPRPEEAKPYSVSTMSSVTSLVYSTGSGSGEPSASRD